MFQLNLTALELKRPLNKKDLLRIAMLSLKTLTLDHAH